MGIVREMKKNHGASYVSTAKAVGVSYPTVMRWNARHLSGGPLVREPGPGKIEGLDLEALDATLAQLVHRPHRTRGTGQLLMMFRNQISRRDLMEMVEAARDEALDERRAAMCDVEWLTPRLVWCMDITEADSGNGKIYVLVVQDMASKYKFEPLVLESVPLGHEVAEHLEKLFAKHGAPLFIKRDNGGNLNSGNVKCVLERHMVIPFNSPAYYPRFNGSIENANRELKEQDDFAEMLEALASGTVDMDLYLYKIFGELNHKCRRVLGGKNSCIVFNGSEKLKGARRSRKEIYEEILNRIVEIVKTECNLKRDAVKRVVIKSWLTKNSHITVSRNNEVLPGLGWENVS